MSDVWHEETESVPLGQSLELITGENLKIIFATSLVWSVCVEGRGGLRLAEGVEVIKFHVSFLCVNLRIIWRLGLPGASDWHVSLWVIGLQRVYKPSPETDMHHISRYMWHLTESGTAETVWQIWTSTKPWINKITADWLVLLFMGGLIQFQLSPELEMTVLQLYWL